jgi:hypothetical protein
VGSGKPYKDALALAERLGYVHDRTNSKGVRYFTRQGCREVPLNPSMQDHQLKKLAVMMQRDCGEQTAKDRSKRDAVAVKERRAGDRSRAAAETARHQLILDGLLAQHDRSLNGIGAVLSASELAAVVRQIEENESELRYWRSLMTTTPGDRLDAGRPRARHRS